MAKSVDHPPFVFFGTGNIATAVLDALYDAGVVPSLIVTAPDRKQGRGMRLDSPPVKKWADQHSVDTVQPEKLDEPLFELLRNMSAPLFALADYGKILPRELLDIPKRGILNVHPSLLPLHRGPTPIHAQVLADNPTVGATIMLLDEKMDHGPLLAQTQVSIDNDDWPPTEEELGNVLATEGGSLLAHVLPRWVAGEVTAEAQDHSAATYCKLIKKADGLIDLNDDPRKNYLRFRAYARWPRTYFFAERNGKKLRVVVTDAEYVDERFVIRRVIPEGKKEMPYDSFTATL